MNNAQDNATVVVSNKRWLYVVVGLLMFLALGIVYAWSVFVAPFETTFGWTRSDTSMAATIGGCCFCLGGLATGFLSKKFPPKVALWAGVILFFAGYFLTGRVTTLTGLYISYGFLACFGVGLSYISVMNIVVRWFPDRKGFVNGLLLMGYGFGSMVFSTFSTDLLNNYGLGGTLTAVAIVYSIILAVGAVILKTPTANDALPAAKASAKSVNEPGLELTTGEMIRRPSFVLFFVWLVMLSAAGLMIINHASPFAQSAGLSVAVAGTLAGMISIFNGLGRVTAGIFLDKVSRNTVMLAVNIGYIACAICLYFSLQTGSTALLAVGFALLGASYGSVMAVSPNYIGGSYGMKDYAMNYSLTNMNVMFASFLGPYLAGALYTSSGSYVAATIAVIAFGVISFILARFLKKP